MKRHASRSVYLLLIFPLVGVPYTLPQTAPRPLPGERVEVTLVLLDVVVTDKKGVPIPGIPKEDFELIVDNTRVPIESLEERCAPEGDRTARTAASAPESARHFVVLYDMSHMMSTARTDAIRATIKYVDELMTDGDRMMVLAFMRGLHVISNFTSDRDALRQRLGKLLEDRSLTSTEAFEESTMIDRLNVERRRNMMSMPRTRMDPRAVSNTFECEALGREAEISSARAIRAFANAMPALGGLPGRKAVLLFTQSLRDSPALPFLEACSMPAMEQLAAATIVWPEIQDLVTRANLAGVSLYAVNAGGMSPEVTTNQIHSARSFQTAVSLPTGGESSILMNDRLAAFRQAARDLSCHYELAYRPPDAIETGRHNVLVRVSGKGRRLRHRSSFTIRNREEASEAQMLSVLSNPGLYRNLPIDVHGYSLGGAAKGKRRFLLKVAVQAADLVLVAGAQGTRTGSVSLRGALMTPNAITCEFSRTISVADTQEADAATRGDFRVGVETLCELEPGEQEIVVAARDETGGSLGAFWARTRIEPPRRHNGAAVLLWGPAGKDSWWRDTALAARHLPVPAGDPLYVRQDYSLGAGESGAITFLACGGSPNGGAAHLLLKGPRSVTLPAKATSAPHEGGCRSMQSAITPGSLEPGVYRVEPKPPDTETVPGKQVSITILP